MSFVDHIEVRANLWACMRERGKLVPGSLREAHNVFTTTGRNLLSKLMAWQTIAATDVPYTNRRPRWIGAGVGSQLEVSNVVSLAQAVEADTLGNFLMPITSPQTFPSSTSTLFIKEFATNEITLTGTPVPVTEFGLFADVISASTEGGTEDAEVGGGVTTTLDPAVATNPPIAYKAIETLTKTVDFTLEVRWEFRYA